MQQLEYGQRARQDGGQCEHLQRMRQSRINMHVVGNSNCLKREGRGWPGAGRVTCGALFLGEPYELRGRGDRASLSFGPSGLGPGQRMEMPEPKPMPVAVPELQADRRTDRWTDTVKPKGRRWSCEGAGCGDDSEQRAVGASKKRLDPEDGEDRGQHTASRSHGLAEWQAGPDKGERATTATADSPQLMCGGRCGMIGARTPGVKKILCLLEAVER